MKNERRNNAQGRSKGVYIGRTGYGIRAWVLWFNRFDTLHDIWGLIDLINKNQILGNIDLLKHYIEKEEPNIKILALLKRIEKDVKADIKAKVIT